MSGASGIAPALSPLPSVSGATTWRDAPKASISGLSVSEEPGEAWIITSGGREARPRPASR
jgi:hypothetical protein